MKKLILLMMLSSVLAGPVVGAAQESNNADVPDKAEIMKFLDLMHTKAQMVQALEGMSKQMRLGAEQGFKEKVPDATPEQLARVDHMFDDIFKSLPIDDMVDAIIPIYQKHLTRSDLAAITAFYASSAGQKILKEMPAIMSEAMQAGGEIGRKAVAAKSQEFDQKLADLVKETQNSAKPNN